MVTRRSWGGMTAVLGGDVRPRLESVWVVYGPHPVSFIGVTTTWWWLAGAASAGLTAPAKIPVAMIVAAATRINCLKLLIGGALP